MRRVALVTNSDWGLYNFRLPLARMLRSHGCEVVFVCPFGEFIGHLRSQGFRCIHWPVERRSLKAGPEYTSLTSLIRIYRAESFDCVHHFAIKPCVYGSIAARVSRTQVINNFTGLGLLYSHDEKLGSRLRKILLPLIRVAVQGVSGVVLLQNFADRQLFVDHGLVQPEHAFVILGSGVDPHLFHPESKRESESEALPLVVMAGRLIKDKGVGEYVQAARCLTHSGIRARFVVAGASDEGNPNCIAEDLRLSWEREGIVKFLGHCRDMPHLLRQARLAVLPTAYGEGVPKFLLEAAATALPIVASDIEGCRVVVQNGINGLLVPPRDARALADAIGKLLTDPKGSRSMGQAGRALVLREFAEDRILEQYRGIYRKIGLLG